jgi:hypothetical protein
MSSVAEHRAQTIALSALLDSCVADGLLSADQAAQVLARSRQETESRPSSPARASTGLAVEALGYLGGVVMLVSTILIADLYWGELTTATRVAVVGAAAAALLAGGLAVPGRLGDVGLRLRSVLWLTATAAFAGFLGVLGSQALDLSGPDTAVLTTAGTAVLAAVLWSRHRHLPQQVVTAVALMATASAVLADIATPDSVPGVGAWAVAVAWFALAWVDRLPPRRVVLDLSAAATVVAAVMTLPTGWGFGLAIGTVAAVVVIAVVQGDLVLLAIGAAGTLLVIPSAAAEWFPNSSALPFVLLGVGLALVGMAVWTARRRSGRARARN